MTDQSMNQQTETSSKGTGEVTLTQAARVSCNGGGGALGHPQIWLNMNADGEVTCPYCSRHFVQKTDTE